MQSITTKGRVGEDGILRLEVPVAARETEIIVVVQPVPAPEVENGAVHKNGSADMSQEAFIPHPSWPPGFFEATAGQWQGEPLERAPQGEYEIREELQ